MKDWWIYRGSGTSAEKRARLKEAPPPPWRRFSGVPDRDYTPPGCDGEAWARTLERGNGYVPDDHETDVVNTALYLRRPLLVTGKPGVGKSTLAYSIATDLGLGPVLNWSVTSRTTLRDGLYLYDAIARLQEANLEQLRPSALRLATTDSAVARQDDSDTAAASSIARFLRLRPLGTALLPQTQPRVLLIDEIDKSDIDLPGDLLTLFEDGAFEIPELTRLTTGERTAHIPTHDAPDARAHIVNGRVRCLFFPIIVLTSNGERDFPPAFLRRCVRLHLEAPGEEKLTRIVRQRLGVDIAGHDEYQRILRSFLERGGEGDLSTDQLLNAIQLRLAQAWPAPEDRTRFLETVMQHLNGPSA